MGGGEPFGGHDDPHVRHFAWRSARRFLRAANVELRGWRAAALVPPGTPILTSLGQVLARLAPSLFGICFVFKVRRAGENA